jgi:hypothetical protein
MAIDLGNGKSVLAMRLLDLSTGKETTLFEREGSRCHFRDDLCCINTRPPSPQPPA